MPSNGTVASKSVYLSASLSLALAPLPSWGASFPPHMSGTQTCAELQVVYDRLNNTKDLNARMQGDAAYS